MLGVPQLRRQAAMPPCLSGSLVCRIHSCKSLGTRVGGSLASPQHTPYLLAGGRATFCISTGRAACKCRWYLQPTHPDGAVGPGSENAPTFCCPWREPDRFLLRLAEGSALQTPTRVTGSCAGCERGIRAAPASAESQRLARRFTRSPAASGALSSARPCFQLGLDAQIVCCIGGGLLLRPADGFMKLIKILE